MSDDEALEALTPDQIRMVAQGLAVFARMMVAGATLPETVQLRESNGISERRYLKMIEPTLKSMDIVHQLLMSAATISDVSEPDVALNAAASAFHSAAELAHKIDAGEGEYKSTMWKGLQDNLEEVFGNMTTVDTKEVEVRFFLKTSADIHSDWEKVLTAALQGDTESVREHIKLSRLRTAYADAAREEQCRLLDMGALEEDPEGPRAVRWPLEESDPADAVAVVDAEEDSKPVTCTYPGCNGTGKIDIDSLGVTQTVVGGPILIACPRCG